MRKKKINNNGAIANTVAITVLSSVIMFGAVGMYRMTNEHKEDKNTDTEPNRIIESTDEADDATVSSDIAES